MIIIEIKEEFHNVRRKIPSYVFNGNLDVVGRKEFKNGEWLCDTTQNWGVREVRLYRPIRYDTAGFYIIDFYIIEIEIKIEKKHNHGLVWSEIADALQQELKRLMVSLNQGFTLEDYTAFAQL